MANSYRTNPVTGWKSVFVNQNFTKRMLGVTKDESDIILKFVIVAPLIFRLLASNRLNRYLFDLVSYNHDLQVRFKWEKVCLDHVRTRVDYEGTDKFLQNSLAIWDNRSNYHTATSDYGQEKRVGDRVVSLVCRI